ncbi:unnamed protein product [Citrullus colocynthis]|uniref:Uncharacterized protein n=1 Tax=Citrullus colocynthis TaxID=252529 RepID=A0ABP0YTR8_9ROSI
MGRSYFLSFLLSFVIALCFSNGFGRNLRMVEAVDSHHGSRVLLEQESGRKWRMMMMETMDYSDPEPNTNVKGGYVSPPPPPNRG